MPRSRNYYTCRKAPFSFESAVDAGGQRAEELARLLDTHAQQRETLLCAQRDELTAFNLERVPGPPQGEKLPPGLHKNPGIRSEEAASRSEAELAWRAGFCSIPGSSTRLILGSDLEYYQRLDGLMPEKKTQ